MRSWQWTAVAMAAAAMLLVATPSPTRSEDLEDCIAATCRVLSEDGGRGTGFLYAVGPERAGGEDLAWIGTAAHVIVGDRLSCEFGRGRVRVEVRPFWQNPNIDAGVIVAPWRAFPRPRPRPIPVAPPPVRIQVGQALFSIGCPGGGPLMLWRGECKGHSGGAMWFWPGPELGRSGSPIFCYLTEGQPAVVGIVSARDSNRLGPNTIGRAVSVQQLRGEVDTSQPISKVWMPVTGKAESGKRKADHPSPPAPRPAALLCQCPGGQCQRPIPDAGGPFDERHYFNPYRQQQQKRNEYLYERVQGGERSQGTLPLPPQQETPKVDLSPLEQRVSRLEQEAEMAAKERAELTRRADVVRDTARELAEKYEKQLPGISGDVKAAIDASTAAAAAAKTAATVAETAKTEATTAKDDAKKTGEQLKEAVDEENPKGIVGRLKARIAEAKAEALAEGKEGIKAVPSIAKDVAMGVLQSYGIPAGIAGLVLSFVVWDIRKKVTEGDPLLVEKIANRVHDRLGPVRERIIERAGEVRQDVHQRLNPDQPQ